MGRTWNEAKGWSHNNMHDISQRELVQVRARCHQIVVFYLPTKNYF